MVICDTTCFIWTFSFAILMIATYFKITKCARWKSKKETQSKIFICLYFVMNHIIQSSAERVLLISQSNISHSQQLICICHNNRNNTDRNIVFLPKQHNHANPKGTIKPVNMNGIPRHVSRCLERRRIVQIKQNNRY